MATSYRSFYTDDPSGSVPHGWRRHALFRAPGAAPHADETFVSKPLAPRQIDVDPWVAFLHGFSPIAANRDDPHFAAIEARIARLEMLTGASGDPFNRQSADRLSTFCHDLAADRKPAIFPLLNGNLRAVWENDAQEQIGIQFLPDGKLQHVLFRLVAGELVETMGTELDERGIRHLVDALGLRRLWFDGGR